LERQANKVYQGRVNCQRTFLNSTGGSVISNVLSDPDLSKEYSLRAITRSTASHAAQNLASKGVEVVSGDVTSPSSLNTALRGAHTVFAMTNPDFSPDGLRIEYNTGVAIADAAVAQGAKYIIFSTLPHASMISKGKYTHITHFDAKAKVEAYIRTLPIKSAFVLPGFFMQNFAEVPSLLFFAPQKRDDGQGWEITRISSPTAKWPLIDIAADTGKFVGAILANPEDFEGQVLAMAEGMYSMDDVVAIMSKITGKDVRYRQVSEEEWAEGIPFEPTGFIESFSYQEEYGYYGSETEDLVRSSAEKARGKLTGLEGYLEKHPLKL
jgi:uncharacterized protein YbjT (DUF2867 family)